MWGQIIGAVAGGLMGANSASKDRKAQQAQLDAQMEGYNFSKPYIERSYDRAEGALNDSLDQGAYQGQTYANQNPYFSAGNHYMGGMGAMGGQGAFDVMQQGQGFAGNYADLYKQGGADRMQQAQDYAIANSGGLVNAAMRDDRRNLQENTLTGIDQAASGSGNMNSSRAGVAEAVANRGFDDRQADVTASINQNLMNQSLGQQNQQFRDQMMANQGLQQGYGQGINAMNSFGNMMTGAGNNFMNYQQGYLNDQRNRFENQRDFALDQNIKYQGGILNNAVYKSAQNPQGVTANKGAGFLGGAMQGAGIGGNIAGFFGNQQSFQPSGGNAGGTGKTYGGMGAF
jgi:hypothetical protein